MTRPRLRSESLCRGLRIDEAVLRGEIDNTVEGRTSGRVWVLGRDEPVVWI